MSLTVDDSTQPPNFPQAFRSADTRALIRDDAPGERSVRQCRYWRTYRFPNFVAGLDDVTDSMTGTVYVTRETVPHVRELRDLAAAGWSVAVESHWPTLKRPGLSVRWLPAWTGAPLSIDAAVTYWYALELALSKAGPGARPIGAPGTTGRDLWLRLLPEDGGYYTPGPNLAAFLRVTASQGRMEMLPPEVEVVAGIHEYDQRLSYLAVMRELPGGAPRVVDGADVGAYDRGKALVSWRRPAGDRRPSCFKPGGWPAEGHGWVDLAEVALARSAGWHVEIDHAVVWGERVNPFDLWARRILAAMGRVPAGVAPGVWRSTWRAIALHTIGAMHGSARRVSHFGSADEAPDDARLKGGGVYQWRRQSAALWGTTHHPEWTTTIWSRARLRLLDAPNPESVRRAGVWNLPAGVRCIGFRTDAVYLTEQVDWRDDGRPGRFRLKREAVGERPWPTSQRELLGALS